MLSDPFNISPIARQIWEDKYRFGGSVAGGDAVVPADTTLGDTWRRVALAAAQAERSDREKSQWETRFEEALSSFAFLPGGRIIAGAGTGRNVTLFNCFVLGEIADDLGAIFEANKEAALTMQQGGGIGHDFSTLRPRGAALASTGAVASGPVSFMDVWDSMCSTVMSAGARRGAMMATLRCDHPDVFEFIDAKRTPGRLTNFNLSVLVTDPFMDAVKAGADWDLSFNGRTYRTVSARDLWDRIIRSTYEHAEPGVIFIDRVNARNNLAYCEQIRATNPCGEQPLPPYGACLLGAINLTQLVRNRFEASAELDTPRLEAHVRTAVRFLDNVIDISRYPLPAQRDEAFNKRRIGLGITGLANALTMCGVRYGSQDAAKLTETWLRSLKCAAYDASANLAIERGAFPAYEGDAILASENLRTLPRELREKIAKYGLRNGCLTTIAPTGTISLLAGNVSSGIEPTFSTAYQRRIRLPDGTHETVDVVDFATAVHRSRFGRDIDPSLQPTVNDLTPEEHIRMQAVAQRHIDSAISKTINCPESIPFEAFRDVYTHAFEAGLKGCTTYRPNPTTGAVLIASEPSDLATQANDDDGAPSTAQRGQTATRYSDTASEDRQASSNVIYLQPWADGAQQTLPGPMSALTYEIASSGSAAGKLRVFITAEMTHGRLQPSRIDIHSDESDRQRWLQGLARLGMALLEDGRSLSEVARILCETGPRSWPPQVSTGDAASEAAHAIEAIGHVLRDCASRFAESCDRWLQSCPIKPAESTDGVFDTCPNCGEKGRVNFEGCWMCHACGTAACG